MAANALNPFGLPPEEAVRWFREKGYALNFDYRDMMGAAHARAFTVAKATQLDLLADLRDAVDRAIAGGGTLREFQRELKPMLVERGWWGKKEQTDPVTGETREVQLGSPRRLRTIYETNLRTAMAAGRWERIERTAQARPYLRYVAIDDGRTRKEHMQWHGVVLPWDHPWWKTHAPPNGWGCRCKLQQLSERDLQRYGYQVASKAPPTKMATYTNPRTGETMQVPRGIDPSFNYNPGQVPRGNEPDDPAPALRDVRTWRDYDRPPAKQAQAGRPPRPALWEEEKTSEDRAETERRFRELFGLPVGKEVTTVTDHSGEELYVSLELLDHVRGAHKSADQRVDVKRTRHLPMLLEVLKNPYEVWLVPYRRLDGSVGLRKRYIGLFSDRQELVVAYRTESGYTAFNVVPQDRIDRQREGYLLYPR